MVENLSSNVLQGRAWGEGCHRRTVPRTEFLHSYLAMGWAWPSDPVGPGMVVNGQLTLSPGLMGAPLLSPQQDSSPAGAPPAAPPRAKPCVPGSLWPGPAAGHQPLPPDVRGQWREGLKGRTGRVAVRSFMNQYLLGADTLALC